MRAPWLIFVPILLCGQSSAPPNALVPTDKAVPGATGGTGRGTNEQLGVLGKGFAPETWPNWALVVVGIAGTALALRTLGKIDRQANAMDVQTTLIQQQVSAGADAAITARQSADAAKESVDALIIGQRGWILINKIFPPKHVLRVAVFGESDHMIPPYFSCKLTVFGATPCRVLNAGIRFHLVDMKAREVPAEPDLPEVPEYRTNIYGTYIRDKPGDIPDAGTVVAPDRTVEMGVELESGSLTQGDVESINAHKKFICAYGFVSYEDAFKREHHTRFCYVYRVNGNRFRSAEADNLDLSRFAIGGPAAYNEET